MNRRNKAISSLWTEHRKRPFPDDCAGLEVKGHCLVLLDSTMAGCLSSFSADTKFPPLDQKSINILEECNSDLESVVPELKGEGKEYFEGLLTLSQEVVNYCRKKT